MAHDKYLGWIPAVRTAISPLSLNHIGQNILLPNVTKTEIAQLDICADQLRHAFGEQKLASEQLADILKETNDLFDAVEASAIDESLRLLLLEKNREDQEGHSHIPNSRHQGAEGSFTGPCRYDVGARTGVV